MPTLSDGLGNQGGIGVNRSLRLKAEVICLYTNATEGADPL